MQRKSENDYSESRSMANMLFQQNRRRMQENFDRVGSEIESSQQIFLNKELGPAILKIISNRFSWMIRIEESESEDSGEETSREHVNPEAVRRDLERIRQDKQHIIESFRSCQEKRIPQEERLLECAKELLKRRKESAQYDYSKRMQQIPKEVRQEMQAVMSPSPVAGAVAPWVPRDFPPHLQLGELDQLQQTMAEMVSENQTLLPQLEKLQGSEDMPGQAEDVQQLLDEMKKEAIWMKQLRSRIERRNIRFCTFLASVKKLLW